MARRGGFDEPNDFYCTKCGNKGLPVIRRAGNAREAGHLKRLYCVHCKEEVNHVECKEFTHYTKADFDLEFEYGNFDTEGNRLMPYGEFRAKLHNEGVELP